ncbi:uncharacterized protein LOC132309655 [Cornus florida]|uniref:uncharacterized protein LOC132309655 n=1 Tax=Cornus florida TaxID=4283 RepID=UPI0028A118AB|nr:uncharacterized protein LOC132309655 [Cornus florida]
MPVMFEGDADPMVADNYMDQVKTQLTSMDVTEDHLKIILATQVYYGCQVKLIRQRLFTAQSRQKSYADKRRRPLSFEVGDHVFLRVSPRKGLMRFGKSGKLSPRYIGPFEILDRVGEVAYKLALPPQLDRVHNVFHVSMLRKYEPDPSHILSYVDVDIDEDVSYEEGPVQILDTQQKVLRNKMILMVKVLWRHHGVVEATWELEQEVRSKYPALFSSLGMS